jgi:GDP-4-dehydro-6-deoxy-D-mannose reductase
MSVGRILVTGAGGFVGRHIVPALAAAFPGATLLGTGLETPARLDITDAAEVDRWMAAHQPDACLHLAGISAIGAAQADPGQAWAVNLQGSLNIAHAIMAQAPQCRMVFISTAEAYGASFKAGIALDEQAPLAPMNLYAATKAAADLALGALAGEGLRLLRLRPFNHTGPGQLPHFVVPAFASQIARIEAGLAPPELLTGALTPERDFLDIRDVCAAYALAIARFDELPGNTILNIASGQPVPIGTVLAQLLALAKVPIAAREDASRLRRVEIIRAAGDAAAARRLLGWAPRFRLTETLASVLADWRAQTAGR